MCENPNTWNDDVKAIAKIMHDAAADTNPGHSIMVRIERAVVAPLRSKLDFILKVLDLTHRYDCEFELMWRVEDNDPGFAIMCSDVFFWGVADSEDLTPETLPILVKALEDADNAGPVLYCARIRQMRPQGAEYEHIDQKYWPLFDACGPFREVGMGNPHKHPGGVTNEAEA